MLLIVSCAGLWLLVYAGVEVLWLVLCAGIEVLWCAVYNGVEVLKLMSCACVAMW